MIMTNGLNSLYLGTYNTIGLSINSLQQVSVPSTASSSSTSTGALVVGNGSSGGLGLGGSAFVGGNGYFGGLVATNLGFLSTNAYSGYGSVYGAGIDFNSPNMRFLSNANSTNGTFQWLSGNNGSFTSRMYIDGSGNVGIGTTSPSFSLDVQNTSTNAPLIRTYGNTYSGIRLDTSNGNANARNWDVVSNFSAFGDFGINQSSTLGGSPDSGTNRFYISQAGNVGIGTTLPSDLLNVNGSAKFNSQIGIGGASPNSVFSINSYIGTGKTTLQFQAGTGNLWQFGTNAGAGTSDDITAIYSGTYGSSHGYNPLMLWNSAGSVSIPVTTSSSSTTSGALQVAGGVGVQGNGWFGGQLVAGNYILENPSSGSAYIVSNRPSSSTGQAGFQFQTAGVADWYYYEDYSSNTLTWYNANTGHIFMSLNTSGTLQLNAYGAGTLVTNSSGVISASSDARLKNVKHPFTTGLKAITEIHPAVYSWKSEEKEGVHTEYAGFIAQDVQKAIPEAVGQGKDGYLTLQDRAITAALVNAIKEQQKEIEDLQQQVKQLSKQP